MAKPNPYLIALGTVALITLIIGVLCTLDIRSAPIGVALMALGGVSLVGWMIVSALVWERENP